MIKERPKQEEIRSQLLKITEERGPLSAGELLSLLDERGLDVSERAVKASVLEMLHGGELVLNSERKITTARNV